LDWWAFGAVERDPDAAWTCIYLDVDRSGAAIACETIDELADQLRSGDGSVRRLSTQGGLDSFGGAERDRRVLGRL
jgi:hypothetical protein